MNAKEFLDMASADPELHEKLSGIGSPESFFEKAKENGYTGDFESLRDAAIQATKERNALQEEELDEVVLKKVAGGDDTQLVMFCA